MSPVGRSRRRWPRRVARSVVAALIVLAATLGRPPLAAAHPLDEYLQALYVTLGADGVVLELDLSPGVLVAPQVVVQIDADGDGELSQEEGQAYGRAVLDAVRLELDHQPYPLTLTAVEIPPMLNLTAGLGTIRLAALPADGGARGRLGAGPHQAFVHNGHAPVKSVYQATVALRRAGEIEVTQQRRDELQRGLSVEFSVPPTAAPAPATDTAVTTAAPPAFREAAPGQRARCHRGQDLAAGQSPRAARPAAPAARQCRRRHYAGRGNVRAGRAEHGGGAAPRSLRGVGCDRAAGRRLMCQQVGVTSHR